MNPTPQTVEHLLERIGGLVSERQALRSRGAGEGELEQNRRAIASSQWELSRALIERYRTEEQAVPA